MKAITVQTKNKAGSGLGYSENNCSGPIKRNGTNRVSRSVLHYVALQKSIFKNPTNHTNPPSTPVAPSSLKPTVDDRRNQYERTTQDFLHGFFWGGFLEKEKCAIIQRGERCSETKIKCDTTA